jgi:hypothetical protein
VGNIAFGFRLSGDGHHLEQDPAEQGALSEIRRLRDEGATLRGIARALSSDHRLLDDPGPTDSSRRGRSRGARLRVALGGEELTACCWACSGESPRLES